MGAHTSQETVFNTPRAQAHSAMTEAERRARIASYAANGTFAADWTVWTALET